VIKKLLRDNTIINPIFRNVIRGFNRFIMPLNRITSLYRIYGITDLNICGVSFKVFSKSDDLIANEIFYDSGYEEGEFRLLKELTKKSKYFIDIGANTGIFSIYAAVANPKLDTLSFEPHPYNFERLLKNLSINKLSNIKAYPTALGADNKELEFTIPADSSLSTTSSINAEYAKNFHRIEYKTILVQQHTIDEVLSNISIASHDVIKVDVEYYELEVLKGAKLTLLSKKPLIMIEILQYDSLIAQFPEMKGKIDAQHGTKVYNFLIDLGYHCYSIGSSGINFVASLSDQRNRNFLFVSRQLPRESYSYDEIAQGITE